MRKFVWILSLGILFGSMGCSITDVNRDSILSPTHWLLHLWKLGGEFHDFRVDVDRTIFNLDNRQVEDM